MGQMFPVNLWLPLAALGHHAFISQCAATNIASSRQKREVVLKVWAENIPTINYSASLRRVAPVRLGSCHPDLHTDLHGGETTAEFQRVTHAYSVLSDASKKTMYDAYGFRDFEDFSDQRKRKHEHAREMFRARTRAMSKYQNWLQTWIRISQVYVFL